MYLNSLRFYITEITTFDDQYVSIPAWVLLPLDVTYSQLGPPAEFTMSTVKNHIVLHYQGHFRCSVNRQQLPFVPLRLANDVPAPAISIFVTQGQVYVPTYMVFGRIILHGAVHTHDLKLLESCLHSV